MDFKTEMFNRTLRTIQDLVTHRGFTLEQAKAKAKADGIAGPAVWEMIEKEVAK